MKKLIYLLPFIFFSFLVGAQVRVDHQVRKLESAHEQKINLLQRQIEKLEKDLQALEAERSSFQNQTSTLMISLQNKISGVQKSLTQKRLEIKNLKLELIESLSAIFEDRDCTNKALSESMRTYRDGMRLAREEMKQIMEELKLQTAEVYLEDLEFELKQIDLQDKAQEIYNNYVGRRNTLAMEKEKELDAIPQWRGLFSGNDIKAQNVSRNYNQKLLENSVENYYRMSIGLNQLGKMCLGRGQLVEISRYGSAAEQSNEGQGERPASSGKKQ